ncbi:hypothetical protein BP6252_12629 [Coleophoma cylindrospora]|uniref:Maleylacetoacetate isomerase n=1 Tax=Coleophoma cylindrospora TaxID=1849047 RepID=A0A3D8QCG1_9HELO|nr:hypothetical protein BP6252_12629 [Coleophoma cylindrospora]
MSTTTEGNHRTFLLYTYFGSTCSARIIIAAKLLGIHLELSHVDLAQGSHQSDSFGAINPSHAVPALVVRDSEEKETVLTQSIAILEYFEEINMGSLLLPPADHPQDRAKVRELVGIIASDIFPPINGRLAQKVRRIRGEVKDQIEWVHGIMAAGFASYEALLKDCGGKYSFGDKVTMADVCLVPAFDMAMGYKLDLTPYPTVKGIYDELIKLDVFKKENWAVKGEMSE